jgi:SAM-dependent methyltransferase
VPAVRRRPDLLPGPGRKRRMMSETDAVTFLAVSREVFAPLYPYYAARFLEQSGLRAGRCLDVGCGGGDLGLAVVGQSACRAVLFDQSPVMIRAARERAATVGLSDRITVLAGDVHALPLGNGCIDLVVSRGSVMFWNDLPKAFAELYRVLAPGGLAICGGGLGPPEIREPIRREMARRDPRWRDGIPPPRPGTDPDRHAAALRVAGILDSTITREDTGHWIVFRKPV